MASPLETVAAITIPFNRPSMVGRELEYIEAAIRSGHASGDGAFTRRCERLLEDAIGAPRAMLTTSCTDALEMGALLLDIKPGEEVIAPAFTFSSTVNAFVLRGARPVFVDIRRDTLNLDERLLKEKITDRTTAVVVMHYAGVGCEMDEISSVAAARGIPVVEDNAQGLFGRFKGKNLGTFGVVSAHSFHETKNISCGEGGALLINHPRYVERAEILREKGTDRSRFFRGQVDKYSWVDIGSSFLPSDIVAAFLLAQLEMRERIQAARKRVWEYYAAQLRDWATDRDIRLPHVPAHCEQSYHMFYLILPSAEQRDAFIAHLRSHGILSVFHYLPLHTSEMGRRLGARQDDCPVTEEISERLVRLPFYNDLSESDQERVVRAARAF